MIVCKSPSEIEKMRAANVLVAEVLGQLAAMVEPGVTTRDLDTAAERLAAQVARLRGGRTPVRVAAGAGDGLDLGELHRRAHALAGRALVVAASRADTAAAILAAERMDAHAAAEPATPTTAPTTREPSWTRCRCPTLPRRT